MIPPVYTTYEVSKFCSVDISTVMGWVDEGKLPAYRTPGGHRRIKQVELLAFLQKYGMPVHPALKRAGPRVLIVDDDPVTVRTLKKVVERIDPTVETMVALDGFEAGRQIELFLPDLVLLDLMLPGLDGFQVCKNIRADQMKKDIKILAISGMKSDGVEKRILENGADGFIKKPFDMSALREAIMDLLIPSAVHR